MKTGQPLLAIVEDNLHVAKAVSHLATKLGFTSQHHPSASSFRQASIVTPPHTIVLDIGLPDADGISLIDHIQTHSPSVGIIVISGMEPSVIHATGELIQARGLRLVGSLHKPFHLKQLGELLTQARGERRKEPRSDNLASQSVTPQLLREAIKKKQFVPFYQAQTTTREGKVVGFEALMRWLHPQWGVVAPSRFIQIATQHDLLDTMTWNILEQVACHWQQLQWHQTTVSVNLSTSFLNQQQLPEKITTLIARYGLNPAQLMLEITESEALQDIPQQLKNLIRLRLAGFPLSIDDFGTGYSSLISLYQIPFQELKIDQTFVMRADSDPIAMEIIHALVFLAQRLQIHLVAEGVETETIRSMLAQTGVEHIQGYLVHRPMPFEELQAWRNNHQTTPLAPVAPEVELCADTLLPMAQRTLAAADPQATIKLVNALIDRQDDDHFRSIFSTIFTSETPVSNLLSLLLRSEWMLLQQLPDVEQYDAIRQQLSFFDKLRQLAVEVKEQGWQQKLNHAEKRVRQEHMNRILAENSVVWLRRGKIKIIAYHDEVPIQAIAKFIDVIGHTITVELNEELARILAINDYHATIITHNNKEQIGVEMIKVQHNRVQLKLGNITANHIGQRRHVRVCHHNQPQATLMIVKGQPAIQGRIIDISISGAKLALPLHTQALIGVDTTIKSTFFLEKQSISGRGSVRWIKNDADNQLLCGITFAGGANDQRLLQEEALRLQRELIAQINHAKLPTLLSSALDEMEEHKA